MILWYSLAGTGWEKSMAVWADACLKTIEAAKSAKHNSKCILARFLFACFLSWLILSSIWWLSSASSASICFDLSVARLVFISHCNHILLCYLCGWVKCKLLKFLAAGASKHHRPLLRSNRPVLVIDYRKLTVCRRHNYNNYSVDIPDIIITSCSVPLYM